MEKIEILRDNPISENDIAILGMSCRYPGGVNSPEDFWSFLLAGGDGIVDVPADRWDSAAYYDEDREKKNKMYVKQGGFIKNIDQFDPMFFGISPKEAPQIDPQHRWLLELTYEAFENAGIPLSAMRGSDTAVYMGQFMHDYEQIQLDSMAHNLISSHSATGPSMTLTSNRISYSFDFTGPSVTLDTACSSSLVALDFACKALLNGDSQVAIAGGVNILLRPELTMSICKASMLSPDARCKSFDASANGYVRSEGAGLVILKKLSDAVRDGNNILAVIKASGVNQDGQTIGITVPNGEAQKKLLLKSLDRAGLAPEDIHYAEAHGTGTAVGDPIEVNALGSVLGHRADQQESCIVGSVKSNIGHSEAAAGMAGLIKTVLAMNHGVIPKNIHYQLTNPAIDLQKLNLRIAADTTQWPDTQGKPRRAIVNSFGFGGTNSNVVLEQAPPKYMGNRKADQTPVINNSFKLLPISAKTENALKDQAKKYLDFLKSENNRAGVKSHLELHDICYTASCKRDQFDHRLMLMGRDLPDMIQSLEGYLTSTPVSGSASHVSSLASAMRNSAICFVFSGMGTQWAGMGKSLYQSEPVFRDTINRCDQALQTYTGWSLVDALFETENSAKIHDTYIAQPAIFATQIALAAQLESWGIKPAVIVGHSAGEVGAAYVAGALSFDDAIKIIFHRSQLQHTTDGMGKMLAVGLTEAELQPYLRGLETKVSIGAVNSEDAITLSGDEQALITIADQLDEKGIFARFLKVGVPYHSPVMDQLKQPLIDALKDIQVMAPTVRLYSTVSGELTQSGDWGPEYWADNVREPVRFKSAIEHIIDAGIYSFLEIASHPALSSSIQKNLQKKKMEGVCIPTLKRDQDDTAMLMQALATLHVQKFPVDWDALYPQGGQQRVLPNYAWQHARYWCEADEVLAARLKNSAPRGGFSDQLHPLLGSQFNSASSLWQKMIDLNELNYLDGHRIEGEVVFPGAAYIEMALNLGRYLGIQESVSVENVKFKKAFFLDEQNSNIIETTLDEHKMFFISAVDPQTKEWTSYCQGIIDSPATVTNKKIMSMEAIKAQLTNSYDRDDFYRHCHKLGLTYRDAFQAVAQCWFNDSESLVEIQLPESMNSTSVDYLLHPCILDAAFQSLFPTIGQGYLPVGISRVNFYAKPERHVYAYLNTVFKDSEKILGDIVIFNPEGEVLVDILGVELASTQVKSQSENQDSILYDFCWQEEHLEESTNPVKKGKWIIFADTQGIGESLATELEYLSQSVHLIYQGEKNERINQDKSLIQVTNPHDLLPIFNEAAGDCVGVIFLWAVDTCLAGDESAETVLNRCEKNLMVPMYIAQALDQVQWKNQLKLILVTQSVHRMDADEIPEPAQGALWGFGRVLAAEHPEHHVSLIDIHNQVDDIFFTRLANEMTHSHYEQEVAFKSGKRWVNRLRRLSNKDMSGFAGLAAISPKTFAESTATKKSFYCAKTENSYSLIACPSPHCDFNELSIKVSCTSLSKENLNKLPLISLSAEQAFNKQYSAYFMAGEITAVGENISELLVTDKLVANKSVADTALAGLAVGDHIIALVSRAPASDLPVPHHQVITKLARLSAAHAINLSVNAVAAYYGLHSLSGLGFGDSILIYNATTSVGIAAIAIARMKRATIFVTAESKEGVEFLQSREVGQVFYSSDWTGISAALMAKGNSQLDVMVNTSPSLNAKKGLHLLKSFGHWIDLECQDLVIGMAFLDELRRKNCSYHSISHAELIEQRPELCVKLVRDLIHLMESGDLSAEFLQADSEEFFPVAQIGKAASFLANQARHQSAILDFTGENISISEGFNHQPIHHNKSYLVTGGLGGLGLVIMEWLANVGATSIVLIGRSAPNEEALKRIQALAESGITLEVMQADVSCAEDVQRVFAEISQRLLPLGGIIHSAGVLEDGVIIQQTHEKFKKVLAPKVQGAWNLHRFSENLPLDFFVCFSSIASMVGWAGQSNYAAANAFMDSLAHRRRALGMPALSINWGPWAEAGMAAKLDTQDIQRMSDAGMYALKPAAGMEAMNQLLMSRMPQAGVFDLEWSKMLKQYPNPARKTVFKNLFAMPVEEVHSSFLDLLSQAEGDQREALLVAKIKEMMAEVLGIDAVDALDKHKNVFEYGINSLMGMEFKNRLQAILKIKLPATLVLKYPTIQAMASFILNDLLSDIDNEEIKVEQDILLWDPQTSSIDTNHEVNGVMVGYTLSVLGWMEQKKTAHFNIGFMVEMKDDKFDIDDLKTTLNILLTYHDNCRLQIYLEDGHYKNEVCSLAGGVSLEENDYRGLGYQKAAELIALNNEKLQASFSFEKPGPLYRFAYYQLDDENPHRIFFLFHHYLSDGISQKIFSEDFERVYLSIHGKKTVYFPPKKYTMFDWNKKLVDFAHTEAVAQLPYWLEILEKGKRCLVPEDYTLACSKRLDSIAKVDTYVLDQQTTQSLEKLCGEKQLEFADLAIYALIKSFSKVTHVDFLWVDLVAHMRVGVFDEVEIPRLFGQISECSPVLFELESNTSMFHQFKSLQAQRELVPNRGLGLRALRFINTDEQIRLLKKSLAVPQVILNFDLNEYVGSEREEGWISLASEPIGTLDISTEEIDVPAGIYIKMERNGPQVVIDFWCNSDVFNQEKMKGLLTTMGEALEDIANNLYTKIDGHQDELTPSAEVEV